MDSVYVLKWVKQGDGNDLHNFYVTTAVYDDRKKALRMMTKIRELEYGETTSKKEKGELLEKLDKKSYVFLRLNEGDYFELRIIELNQKEMQNPLKNNEVYEG